MRGMKKRAANFTPEEKNELLEAVLRHRDVLFGRVGPPSRYWAAKKAAWCDVVDAVNTARPSPGRNVHECRRKLKDLKAAARKKFMDANGSWKNEGAKDATTEELKILKLLGSEDKADDIDVDLSIVKVEHKIDTKSGPGSAPLDIAMPRSESELVIGMISTPVTTKSELMKLTPPSPPLSSPPIPTPRPQISVISQAMLKVEPIKRPVGQVAPLPMSGNDNTSLSLVASELRASQNRAKPTTNSTQMQTVSTSQSQALACLPQPSLPQRPHVLNVPLNCLNSARSGQTAEAKHAQGESTALVPAQSRKHLRSYEPYHANGQSLPFAEFCTPEPMKRVKLFVRNVPTLNQPSTSVGPTARGNVLNFAICSCKDHPAPILKDMACQTTYMSENAIMLQTIIETQKMTAKALQNLESIAQQAREKGLFDKSESSEVGDYAYNQRPKVENVKIEKQIELSEGCKLCTTEDDKISREFDNDSKTNVESMDICKECPEK